MKTLIIVVLAALSLTVVVAKAERVSPITPQQDGSEYNRTAGAAGWG